MPGHAENRLHRDPCGDRRGRRRHLPRRAAPAARRLRYAAAGGAGAGDARCGSARRDQCETGSLPRALVHRRAAGQPAAAALPGRAIVLAGRFDPTVINAYLAQTLHGTPIAAAAPPSYEITLTDPMSCQPSGTWVVTVAPGWILIADRASHAALLPRLLHPAARADGGLDWWRSLARRDVVSIGLRNPSGLESATAAPMLKAAAQGIALKADAFEHVYLGFRMTPMPPAGEARLVIDAKDEARASEQIAAWRHAIDQSRARWAAALPSVAALYDSVAIRSEGARNTVEVTVNRATIANARHVASELISAVLGGFGVDAKTQAASAEPERIDRNPAKFTAEAT